jgi:hypothetical protein
VMLIPAINWSPVVIDTGEQHKSAIITRIFVEVRN